MSESRNSFLDNIDLPDSQRRKVDKRRSRSKRTGRGSSSDPIRNATPQEIRQDKLQVLQSELSRTGARLGAGEAQSILDGKKTVSEIRQQISTRLRRESLQDLQKQLSNTRTRLTPQESQSIIDGTVDINSISQRAFSRAKEQRREDIQERLSGIDLSDSRIPEFANQGLTPTEISSLQARETFVGRQLVNTRNAALQQGVVEEFVPRTDLFFGERVVDAAEKRIGSLRAKEPTLFTGGQEFVLGASVGAGRLLSFGERLSRSGGVTSKFFPDSPQQERAISDRNKFFSSVGSGVAIAATPFIPLAKDLIKSRIPGLPRTGLSRVRASSVALASLGAVNVLSKTDDLLFGLSEPGAQAVQSARGGQLRERELGMLVFEGALSYPALQPVRYADEISSSLSKASSFVDDLVGTLPSERRVLSVRQEGIIGDLPRSLRVDTANRMSTLRPATTVFDNLIPSTVSEISNPNNRFLLTVQERATIEGLLGGTQRTRGSLNQRTQLFPVEPARRAFVKEKGGVLLDEFGDIVLVPADTSIPSRRRATDNIGFSEQRQADLLADRIDARVEAENILRIRSKQDKQLVGRINPPQELIDQLLFVQSRPTVASRSLLDFDSNLRPALRSRFQSQNPDTISISQLLPEREIIRISDSGVVKKRFVGGDIGKGVPRFSVSSRGGRSANDLLREAFDEANNVFPPVRKELFFDPVGVSSLVSRRTSRTPRSVLDSVSSPSRLRIPNLLNNVIPERPVVVGASPFAFLSNDSSLDNFSSRIPKQEFSIDSEVGLSTSASLSSLINNDSLLGNKKKTLFAQDASNDVVSIPRTKLDQEIDGALAQTPRTKLDQELDSVSLRTPRTRITEEQELLRATPPGKPRIPRTKTPTPPRRTRNPRDVSDKALEGSEEALFEVTVGRKNNQNYEELGVGTKALIKKARKKVSTTPAASLKIVSKNSLAKKVNVKSLLGKNFSKSKDKKRVNSYVEKTSARINSPGELLGITAKGIKARKSSISNNAKLNRRARELVSMGVPLRKARKNLGGGLLNDFF